jgi:hypothetical protein
MGMKFLKIFLQCLLVLFVSLTASVSWAGQLIGELDRQASSLDEPLWFTLTIEGSLDGDVIEPETDDFDIQRTGESTNISILNGSMSKQTQYTYRIQPLKDGSLTLPPFKARIDKQDLATQSYTVSVKSGGVTPSPGEKQGTSGVPIFVERDLPKTTLYEGEAIVSKVRLFTRAQLRGATPAREASPNWRLISEDGQKNLEMMRDGQRWSVIEMQEALIPLRSGALKSPVFGINATWVQQVRRKGSPRSIFDMLQGGGFGFGEEVSRKLTSRPVDVIVKPLPSPKPEGFADMVGAFSVKANVSKRDLSVGDTATVTIEVKGQGALDRMLDLKLGVVGAKVYTDKPTLTESIQAGPGLVSAKTFKFAVVPHTAGAIDLGSIKVAAFNPFTESYETLSAALGSLQVSGSGAQAPVSQSAVGTTPSPMEANTATDHNQKGNQSPTELAGKKIDEAAANERKSWLFSPVAIAIEILLLALAIAAILFKSSWRMLRKTSSGIEENPKKDLQQALAGFDQPDGDPLVVAVGALKRFLADGQQDPAAMTSSDLLRAAEVKGVLSDHQAILRRVLNHLDRRAYAGDVSDEASQGLIQDMRTVMRDLVSRGG